MSNEAAAVAAVARVTPTASMSVRVPWGDWLEQAIEHEKPIIEAAAETAASLALHQLPFGLVVSGFIGPKIIDQYVDMGLSALEGVAHGASTTVDGRNTILTTTANLVIKNEPAFASWVGDQLEPMIKAALAKIGIVAP